MKKVDIATKPKSQMPTTINENHNILNKHFNQFFSDPDNIVQLFNHSNDGLIITDYKNRIIMANPAFLTMTGYDFHEIYMRNPRILKSGRTRRHVFADMWQSLLKKGTWTGEVINRRKNREIYYSYVTITYIKKEREEDSYFIAISRDVTDRRKATEQIRYLAHHDTLTDLPNRTLFMKLASEHMKEADKVNQRMAVLFIDLDRFKLINDTLGHYCGDIVLKEISQRLHDIFGKNSVISRFGGDEFTVLLPDGSTEKKVKEYLYSFFNNLKNYPILLNNKEYFLTASVGVSFYPDHGDNPEKLVQTADTAMYRSKDESTNNFQFYTHSMKEGAYKQLLLSNQLQKALAEDQFVLYYQLQMDLKSEIPYGMEALIRWNHPTKGILPPSEFIFEAEEIGLMDEIDNWVMKEAMKQMKKWHDFGYDHLSISVNISKKQFEQRDFVKRVQESLRETGIKPELVCLEITENFALNSATAAVQKLKALKKLGVQIALDDFGTGYSSLSQLVQFPIDILKIDQGFVKTSNGKDKNAALIKTIIQISRQLDFAVVCEGVETETQLKFIKAEGCDVAQGYWYEKPVPAEQIEILLPIYMDDTKVIKDERVKS